MDGLVHILRQAPGALAAMWLITYDDGHGRPVMIRRVATEQEAFNQACMLFVVDEQCKGTASFEEILGAH